MTNIQEYQSFLENKIKIASLNGLDCELDEINPILYPHQRDIVQWAVQGGQRAIFAQFGLGKSLIQAEIVRIIQKKTGANTLTICPLGVKQEFTRDGRMVGVDYKFIRTAEEMEDGHSHYITNYESVRDGKLDPNIFDVVTLDEASVLRSYGSKTYQEFLTLFSNVKYKFVATATPSPNRYKELIHYAGFLGIMDTGQALTRFFQRDSTQANNLTLYPHKEEEFWLWMHSWSIFLQKPSELGYSDEGYDMPEMKVIYHEVDSADVTSFDREQQLMFGEATMSLGSAAREKRESIDTRVNKLTEIVNNDPDSHYIFWHDLENERHAIKKAIPESVSVYGSLDLETREQRIIDFSDGGIKYLSTKPSISGSGCNFQRHCHKAIFLGVGFKFNDFIQSIHRIYRFLQTEVCEIHVIHTVAEREVLSTLNRKWEEHEKLLKRMSEIVKQHGLNKLSTNALMRGMGVDRKVAKGKNFDVANNDCVDEAMRMKENSVDLIITSVPFCYDEKTEVLTSRGWLGFDKIDIDNDLIATVSDVGVLEYHAPSNVVWERYEGEMIKFSGRSFNLLVTPNHRMYAARRGAGFSSEKFKIITAEEITAEYENTKRLKEDGNGRISRGWKLCLVPPKTGGGNYPSQIDIPPLPENIEGGHGVELYWIKTEDFVRLAGWYLSEGHADSFDSSRQGGRVSIGQSPQKNKDNYEEIVALVKRIGLRPSIGEKQVSMWCRNLAYFMIKEFGHGCKNMRIPRWVLDLHPILLEILRDTMMKGDGAKDGTSYASISPQLRDDFQELCVKTGWRAGLTGTKVINTGTSQIYPEIRHTPKRIHYSGMIGCATVKNGTMVVRRNGQTCVSGNSNHYEYTPNFNDFGHTENNEHFWEQMDFLTPELLRILNPGRLACIHVKDRILFGNVTGKGIPTVSPFHAEAIFHYIKHGFDYTGMITVVTDVVRENNQTYRLGWSENCKDGTKMGVGSPEYVLLFRKPQTDRTKGYADIPVAKSKEDYSRARWQIDAHAFWRSSGNRLLTADELAKYGPDEMPKVFMEASSTSIYDYEQHVQIGETLEGKGKLPSTYMSIAPGSHDESVWVDVNRMLTLNGEQTRRGLEMHICPLQIDIIDRLITRYSNKNDLVYDPFGGLMSVPYRAVLLNRRGGGSELNEAYFRDGVRYLEAAEREVKVPTLFDLEDIA